MGACGLAAEENFQALQVALLQNAMPAAGIVTLIQLFSIGPCGGKVPIIMGTSSGFIGVFSGVARTMGSGILTYEKCALELRERICRLGAQLLNRPQEQAEFDGRRMYVLGEDGAVSLPEIVVASMCGHDVALETTYTHSSPVSPALHGRRGGDRGRPRDRACGGR